MFSFLYLILICVRIRLGYIGVFGFEWFYLYYSLYSTLLLVNFFWIVSTSGCKLIGPNHLNLVILCVVVLFFILHFFTSLVILDLHLSQQNKLQFIELLIIFVITSVRVYVVLSHINWLCSNNICIISLYIYAHSVHYFVWFNIQFYSQYSTKAQILNHI